LVVPQTGQFDVVPQPFASTNITGRRTVNRILDLIDIIDILLAIISGLARLQPASVNAKNGPL
jgi:hypothetical protein